jgi:hypothetical protein
MSMQIAPATSVARVLMFIGSWSVRLWERGTASRACGCATGLPAVDDVDRLLG